MIPNSDTMVPNGGSSSGGGGSSGANPTATAGPVAINGTATTFMRSDAAPAIQKASAVQFGIVEVDGTTITATGGVISSANSGAPGGAVNDVQFNNGSGGFGGDAGFVYNGNGSATLHSTGIASLEFFSAGVADVFITANSNQHDVFGNTLIGNYFSGDIYVTGKIGTASAFGAPSLTAKDATDPYVRIWKTSVDWLQLDGSNNNRTDFTDAASATLLSLHSSSHASPGFYTNFANFILRSLTAITGGGTANTPTLTAGPVNGNPTKWLPYDDNGTTRYIPSW